MAKPTAAPKFDAMQIFAIVSIVTTFAAQVAVNVIGKKGAALRDGIIESVRAALPPLEQILGKDLLNDAKFNEALEALVSAFIKAPAKRK